MMAPPFGSDKREAREQEAVASSAEMERLLALPLTDLAAEIMVRTFGPGGPGAPGEFGTWEQPQTTAMAYNPMRLLRDRTSPVCSVLVACRLRMTNA
jgi:hypothetical protein